MSNANGSNNNTLKKKDLKGFFNEYCSIPEQVKNEISMVSRWTTLVELSSELYVLRLHEDGFILASTSQLFLSSLFIAGWYMI